MQAPCWILGVESSCDETAAAVVCSDGTVASDVVHSQVSLHAPYGGVVPELASRDHLRAIGPVVRAALERSGRSLADIDAVAVTCRPGLIGALLVGVQAAKAIAYAAHKPIIGVDHLVGHLLAPFLRRPGDETDPLRSPPKFPYIALLASGGHTAIYRVDAPLASGIRELGATRDDASGEAFDKVAKLLGLGYPGGPVVDRRSKLGDAARVKLVRPMAHRKGFEFSFSGLKTQVAQWAANHAPLDDVAVNDVCASFQSIATRSMADKLMDAAKAEGVAHVVITGGVAANRELRERVTELAKKSGVSLTVPAFASCTDNGAMIAYAGAQRFIRGEVDGTDLDASSQTILPRRTHRGPGPRDREQR